MARRPLIAGDAEGLGLGAEGREVGAWRRSFSVFFFTFCGELEGTPRDGETWITSLL